MLRMSLTSLTVLLTGLVAGVMLGTGGSLLAARSLPEACWTESFQRDDPVFARIMIPLFIAAMLCLIALAIVTRGRVQGFVIASGVLFAVAVAITQLGNVPINLQVRLWTPGAAPAEWQELRDRWLWFHLGRSISAFLSFAFAVAALSSSAASF